MKLIGTAAIAALLLTSGADAARPQGCLSDNEFADLMVVLSPDLFQLLNEQCAAAVPNGRVLGNQASTLPARLDAASNDAWPRTWPPLAKALLGEQEAAKTPMTREQMMKGMRPELSKIVIIKNKSACSGADHILELAEPLPVQNLARIIVEVVRMDNKSTPGVPLCPKP